MKKNHWQTIHQTYQPIEPFTYEVCGLSNSNLLLEHDQNFHEDPQSTCEQCDQRFETQEIDSQQINS